jgi:uncharacterized delta-60 repeat protein
LYKESLEDGVKIFRFNADGTVDSSFGSGGGGGGGGGGGSITYQVNEGQAFIDLALAIQTDGKILIGYTADSARGNGKSYLVRLNADGSVDNAFRGGFANGVPLPSELFKVYDMAVGPGGKVYANGVTKIVGLNSDGSLDSGFGGGDGVAEAPALNGVQVGDSRLTAAPDGKLLVLSKQDTAHGHMPILARLLASGRRLRKSRSAAMPPGMISTITSSRTA